MTVDPAASEATSSCSSCGTGRVAAAKFCLECGAPFPLGCPACHALLPPRAKFCVECGRPLRSAGSSGDAEGGGAALVAATALAAAPPASLNGSQRPSGPPVGVAVRDAERRQMTVLFADLVDSTGMSSSVDAEDYREVISRYIETVEAVVRRYDGYVANYLGDGILVYFGYPRAHEEDSRRACFAALDMVDAVRALKVDLADHQLRLAVRVGIHTGTTVLGSVNGASTREVMAVGETLNLAARLQTFAEPNTAVVSATTERLVRGFCTMRHLGVQPLRGVSHPVEMYQLTGVEERAELGPAAAELSPLIGRDLDLQILRERWADSRTGKGRVVVMTGDAGLGKSRLIRALRAEMAGPVTWLHCRATPFFADTPLWPIVDALGAHLGLALDGSEADLTRLEATIRRLHLPTGEAAPLLAGLLGLAGAEQRYPPLAWPAPTLRKRCLELLVELLVRMAQETPLALILEDAHWMDDTTLELTDLLSQRAHSGPLFILVAGRPGFDAPLVVDCEVVLRALPHDQVEILARNVAARHLPMDLLDQIARKAEGNPLYVEELTRNILESQLEPNRPVDGCP
ncbi:MAG TPA: adenylate/guanylate cyclase domain-containing protein, partial [Acidimicrobiia bacterium]|nr:adenylate/guanylate cyclase domain-containing protein [Acidimicrobiia bacterium]